MALTYQEVISTCSKITQILSNNDKSLAFYKVKDLWNTTVDISSILSENLFKNTIASVVNKFDNELIYTFIINNAKNILKENYSPYLLDLNDYILKDAVATDNLTNIKKYILKDFNIKELLQISIKYGAWSSFELLIDNYVVQKQKKSVVQWSQKEFWQYAVNGYANIDFIKNLISHPLSINTPIKQPIYSLIQNSNFEFVFEFINDNKCLELLKEINIEHYYKVLIKKISENKSNEHYEQNGINLLKNSYEIIPFDLGKFLFNIKFKKENPQLVELINKFILKDKLDLLPQKIIKKHIKI